MSVTFAGYPIGLLPDDYADWITTYHSLTDFRFSDLWHFEGYGLGHLPLPPMPKEDQPEVGVLYWPTGLTRCAFAHYLVGLEQLEDIRTALGTTAGPADLILTDEVNGTSVTVPMYFLCARPLSQLVGNDQQLYLMTLVDVRYHLRWRTGSITSVSTWSSLLSTLATALGITLTADTVDTDYSSPTVQWLFNEQYLSPVVDAVCNRIGHRVVANLNGTFKTVTVVTASSLQEPQVEELTKTAGGVLERADLRRPVPAGIKTVFRNAASTSPYTVTKTLSGLAISQYSTATGVSGQQATVYGELVYDGTNATACDNYATQAATDWYLWALTDTDITYPSVTEWEPTGCEDRIEWKYFADRVLTRVVRWPFQIPLAGTVYGSTLTGPVPGTSGYPVTGNGVVPLLTTTPNVLNLSTTQYVIDLVTNGGQVNLYTVANPGNSYTNNATVQYTVQNSVSGTPTIQMTVWPNGTTGEPISQMTITPAQFVHLFTMLNSGNPIPLYVVVNNPSTGVVQYTVGNSDATQGNIQQFTVDNSDRITNLVQKIAVYCTNTSSTTTGYHTYTCSQGYIVGTPTNYLQSIGPATAAPTSLAATAGYQQATLTWTAPTGAPPAALYRVYQSTSSNMASATLLTLTASTNYTATGLTTGTTYYFGVTGLTTGGAESLYSNITSAVPIITGSSSPTPGTLTLTATGTVTADPDYIVEGTINLYDDGSGLNFEGSGWSLVFDGIDQWTLDDGAGTFWSTLPSSWDGVGCANLSRTMGSATPDPIEVCAG